MTMEDDTRDNPGVITPPPLIYAAALGAGLLLQRAFPIARLPRQVTRVVGWPLVTTSFLLGGSALRTMLRANTNVDPRHPATTIVVAGPFRYTRNPIYLSFTMLYLGIASLRRSLWPLLLLPGVLLLIRRGVIDREERYLERKFGEQYRQYKAQVRRWL
jgi:protein-S-isoprenylcysteine O-methyltransferase Ste14